jgi:hypothetical protein
LQKIAKEIGIEIIPEGKLGTKWI